MFDKIESLYSKGDLNALRNAMLHSASLYQGGFTAFGEGQQNRLWLDWLSYCGLSTIDVSTILQCANNTTAIVSTFTPSKGKHAVPLVWLVEHQEQVIKRIELHTDTQCLANSIAQSSREFSHWWPTPDPLMLSDYDQQQHPETFHARPTDIAQLGDVSTLTDKWWQIWQQQQLSNIADIYCDDAQIFMPKYNEALSTSSYVNAACSFMAMFNRHYCQLEAVHSDQSQPNVLVVKWQLEGDVKGATKIQRVRLPMISVLEHANGKIVQERLVYDTIAFKKQFPQLDLSI